MVLNTPASLADYAIEIINRDKPLEKIELAKEACASWFKRQIPARPDGVLATIPLHPGRPDRPILLSPRDMPRRRAGSRKGMIALVHALTHIELNAIDMTWDTVARFSDAQIPASFLDEAVKVGHDEALHFEMINSRLEELGAYYGDLPAHGGLWEAAQNTRHDLLARLAIVPLVLEARGLDVSPAMIDQVRKSGESETADTMQQIYDDEITHVAFGAKWFEYICDQKDLHPENTFKDLVKKYYKGTLKPPFNVAARAKAGVPESYYK